MQKFAVRVLLLGGLAGLGFAGAASAGSQEGTLRELTVQYNQSSLATDEGTREVYSRLARAAEAVCPNEPTYGHLHSGNTAKCRQAALSAAVAKIHNQRLAALHAANWKAG
jgi:UrcA family protein